MIILAAKYLLIGVIIGLLLEVTIRATHNSVSGWERYALIVFWPVMVTIFIIYFIKGLLED